MRDFGIVFVHVIVTLARLARPGGLRGVVAESVLVRHQLLILNRGRKRAPNLRATDRIIADWCTLFMRLARVLRSAIVLKPSTLLHLHSVLRKRKYRMLFSLRHRRRPGPKGPNQDLIEAIVAMKRSNPGWGCPRIAQQISLAFGVEIDKDVVRRVLRRSLPAGIAFGRSFLAYVSRSHEGQFVELRFIPVRIGNAANPLGSYCDGPVYASHHWFWHSPRHRGWSGPLPDVPSGDSRAQSAQISQLGSRSAVSIPPVGGQSSDPQGNRTQDCSLRAAFASLRRAAYRHDSSRVSRPHLILEHSRSGSEADRFSTLL